MQLSSSACQRRAAAPATPLWRLASRAQPSPYHPQRPCAARPFVATARTANLPNGVNGAYTQESADRVQMRVHKPALRADIPEPITPGAVGGSLCLLCLLEETGAKEQRVSVPAELAGALAGGPVSAQGGKVVVPIDRPGCKPKTRLPPTCSLKAQRRGRTAGPEQHYIGSLTRYLRSNGARPRSTLLLLTAVLPDPAHGAQRASLRVQLINYGDGDPRVFEAMQDHVIRCGPWLGTLADFETHFHPTAAAALAPSASAVSQYQAALAAGLAAGCSPTPPSPPAALQDTPGAAGPEAAAPSPDLGSSPCMLRLVRKTSMSHGSRFTVPSDFATALAGGPLNTGEKVSVPVYLPGSHPQSFLPVTCFVGARLELRSTVNCYVGGLRPFVWHNEAEFGATPVLLTLVPPDPARGYPTPSLAVQLISHKDVGTEVFGAMQEYLTRSPLNVWRGRWADCEPFFAAEARRLRLLGVPDTSALWEQRDVELERSPQAPRMPRAAGYKAVDERCSMLPVGLPQVHVEAVRAFMEAAPNRKLVRLVQQAALIAGMFSLPKTFVAACGVQPKQSGVVTVNVPVAQHHPRGSPLESIALYCYQQRYRHRAGHMPRWEAHGLEAWLAGAGAALADVLLVWLDGPEPGAGKPGAGEQRPEGRGRARGKGAGEDAEVGALGLRLHLIRRADVGSEALKAIVGLVTGW